NARRSMSESSLRPHVASIAVCMAQKGTRHRWSPCRSPCWHGLVAIVYALLLTLPVPTMFLALAPAGIAEMALTAKVLGLDAALITGFQLVRILMVTLGAAAACR